MKRRSPLLNLSLALLGVLAIAAFLIFLGSQDSTSFPSAESYQPSGASALTELLKMNGYRVEVDKSFNPDLKKGDTALVFDMKMPKEEALFLDDSQTKQSIALADRLARFVEQGGSLISLPLASEYSEASIRALGTTKHLRSLEGQTAAVTWTGKDQGAYLEDEPDDAADLWFVDSPNQDRIREFGDTATFVRADSYGDGVQISFADGIVATNRFIDKAENAKVIVDAIRSHVKQGSRIVVVEAAIGNARELGLMDLIGPWAKAAWMQLLFLGLVIAYTLGKPFGLPTVERRRQYGARELLDAMSETLMRGRMVRVVLGSARDEARRLVTRRFGSETGATRSGEIPEKVAKLREKLALVESAMELKTAEDQTLKLVSELDQSLQDLEVPAREGRPPR